MINTKKITIGILLFAFLLIPLANAQIEINSEVINNEIIPEFEENASFYLEITNNFGEDDIFEVYSLANVRITTEQNFEINSRETKTIEVHIEPTQRILEWQDTFSFEIKVKGQKSGIYSTVLNIRITRLKEALDINVYNIQIDDEDAIVSVRNRLDYDFGEINTRFSSAFFSFEENFNLSNKQEKEFETKLNQEKLKTLPAGNYLLTTSVNVKGIDEIIESIFNFAEIADIETTEIRKGTLLTTEEISKKNLGNLPQVVQVNLQRNIFSRLFTSFNINPSEVEREGFSINYNFQKELQPGEELFVKARTNFLYPILILIVIIILVIVTYIYTTSHIIIKKKAKYVKTKGGEFALKITVFVKAKRFVEKISVVDKIPAIVKLYKDFGISPPDKIDEKNRRVEWYIDNLNKGEERLFSYIIYSKVGVIGRFELPRTLTVYEREGKIKETSSNKVYFLTDIKKKKKE
jgi:hypothetical protein